MKYGIFKKINYFWTRFFYLNKYSTVSSANSPRLSRATEKAISKVFKNGRKFLLRSANGAFSVVTLWVAMLKLPFPAHQQSFFSQILPDFWNYLYYSVFLWKEAEFSLFRKKSTVYLQKSFIGVLAKIHFCAIMSLNNDSFCFYLFLLISNTPEAVWKTRR